MSRGRPTLAGRWTATFVIVIVVLVGACSSSSLEWSDDDVDAAFSAETVDDRTAVTASMGSPDTFAISWEESDGNLAQLESWWCSSVIEPERECLTLGG